MITHQKNRKENKHIYRPHDTCMHSLDLELYVDLKILKLNKANTLEIMYSVDIKMTKTDSYKHIELGLLALVVKGSRL